MKKQTDISIKTNIFINYLLAVFVTLPLYISPYDTNSIIARWILSTCPLNSIEDTSLNTENAKWDVSINKEVYELIRTISVKANAYIFNIDDFKQSGLLEELLKKLNIPRTTFHDLPDTHVSYLFAQDIDIVYVLND